MFYLIFFVSLLISFVSSFGSQYYVVERSRGSLGVIENREYIGEIKHLGDMNHAIVKYGKCYAYVISRDGVLSKIDPRNNHIVAQTKAGNSSIDFYITKHLIVVANYDPDTVAIFNHNLKLIKSIKTGSRNVGIKVYKHLIFVLLMDKNAILVLDDKNFSKKKVIKNVGVMPFDAILDGDRYIVSFFVNDDVGILDTKNMKYRIVHYGTVSKPILKIPHYGLFSMWHGLVFMPLVGERAIGVVNIDKGTLEHKIPLLGYPVFVIVSQKDNLIAVNYSGDNDDYMSFIDPFKMKLIKNMKVARRVMHMRFSKDGRFLYISDYFDNKVKILDTSDFKIIKEITVPQPSGIFRLPERLEECHG
jgi:protein NirF